jgi:hypothetical protein
MNRTKSISSTLKFGFIKLTDMAPIAIAYEKGYFEDEGLYVTIEAQANWKVLLNGVIDGSLDGAHIITPFSMDLNVFFRYNATYPYYSDAIWYLTQMRRWGQISDDKSDQWYKRLGIKSLPP